MIENSLIKKMARAVTRKQKSVFSDRNITHPGREWFLSLLVAVVVLLGGVGWSVFQYIQFSKFSADSIETTEEVPIYKAGLVKDAINDFQIRKKNYEDLKKQMLGNRSLVEKVIETPTSTLTIPEIVATSTENNKETVEEEVVASPRLSI